MPPPPTKKPQTNVTSGEGPEKQSSLTTSVNTWEDTHFLKLPLQISQVQYHVSVYERGTRRTTISFVCYRPAPLRTPQPQLSSVALKVDSDLALSGDIFTLHLEESSINIQGRV